MGESTKSVLALLMIVGTIAAALAWTADHPDTTTWGFRVGGPVAAVLALGLLLKLHFRRDLEYDYVRAFTSTYFNRGGFCFSFVSTTSNGIAFLDAYFQSQHENRCIGRLALRPARGFFMTRAKISAITYEIDCPPAGFGFVRIAVPIPGRLQGKRQTFEVGASVSYPDGKGHRVRFHDGIFLRSNTNFGNSFGTALAVAGAATGSIALSKPATATIDLPVGVAEELPGDIAPETRVFWQLGEPTLKVIA